MTTSLALDLGTTSISAAAVAEDGRVVARASRPNTANVENLPAGHAEQDPQELRRLALEVLRDLTGQLDSAPHCLGLTGQMHGTLLVDADRRPLTNLITWQDRRANEPFPGSERTYLDEFLERCAGEDLFGTGCRPAPGYMGMTLFVLSEQNRLPSQAVRAAFLADWMAAELCDGGIVTDRSNAASSGLYDLRRDNWSQPLTTAAGLRRDLLPEVFESGAPIGELRADLAGHTGLPAGLPVTNAVGDNQAAVLGSVPAGAPAIQINIGTGGQINWPVRHFLRVEHMDTRYLPRGRFMLVGAGLAGGDAYAWVKRRAAEWLHALEGTMSTDEIYDRMNNLAARVPPGCEGLVCEPLFRGTRRRPQARGSFTGVTVENFTLGHVARAVLEGVARGLYSFYEQAGEARPEHLERIIGSGNALRKNPLLVEILARTFDREVWLPVHDEEAAYGAALLAGAMTGLWPDLEAAGRQIRLVSAAEAAR